jgi:hypothetical protein
VPDAAVIRDRSASYVNLVGPDGQVTRTRFEPGSVGDENTAVVSGLSAGQRVLLPLPRGRPIALITTKRTKVETDGKRYAVRPGPAPGGAGSR